MNFIDKLSYRKMFFLILVIALPIGWFFAMFLHAVGV